MPKFQALFNIKDLSIPFVQKDSEGKIISDQSIVFNRGMNVAKGIITAYLHTENQETIDYLRLYPGNLSNGGSSFEEVTETEKLSEENQLDNSFLNNEPETDSNEQPDQMLEVIENVNTVNEASQILLDRFDELVTRDVNTRAKITAVAAAKGLSFPNL